MTENHVEKTQLRTPARSTGLLRKKELAAELGVHPRTVDNWIAARKIPFIKVTNRLNLYRLADVMRALQKLEVKTIAQLPSSHLRREIGR